MSDTDPRYLAHLAELNAAAAALHSTVPDATILWKSPVLKPGTGAVPDEHGHTGYTAIVSTADLDAAEQTLTAAGYIVTHRTPDRRGQEALSVPIAVYP